MVGDTQGAMGVLPRAKTKARPAGDPNYGGGVTSGSKVKRVRKTRAPAPVVHTQNAPETSTQPLPATPLPETPTTNTTYIAPAAPVIQTYLPTPPHMYPGSAPLFYQPLAPYYRVLPICNISRLSSSTSTSILNTVQ
ncbi:hypothetical protein R3P38DRAFT_3184799 [Favolaschia claudopus]|uniref:Uncharacterized protein n=1 Tax=Favolaschia claudopus TaxID=2862362 RepID=A0AAW0C628_9AGAR